MTLFTSNQRGNQFNSKYPRAAQINAVEDLQAAARFDHVSADYKDFHRKNANFKQSNCLMMDCDNGETDNPDEWVTPQDVHAIFPNVKFYVVYSRNHMKEKDGKSPRPKFHIYFPIATIENGVEYRQLKETVRAYFPAFDNGAKDAARFFYGVDNPQVEYFEGDLMLTEFIQAVEPPTLTTSTSVAPTGSDNTIKDGERNTTLSRIAAKILKRHGENDIALQKFNEAAARCESPLPHEELSVIWQSATHFYRNTIKGADGYVDPTNYIQGVRAMGIEATKHNPNNSSKPFASRNFGVTGIIALSAAASALMVRISSVGEVSIRQ